MKTNVTKEARDHARALLLALKQDPNPSNIAKVQQIETPEKTGYRFGVGRFDYLVYEEQEVSSLLEELLLSYPLTLPARYLALLIEPSFSKSLTFEEIIQVARNFKQIPTSENIWCVRKMIDLNPNLSESLREILLNEFGDLEDGVNLLAKKFNFLQTKSIDYKGKTYWVFEFDPVFKPEPSIEELTRTCD